MKTTLTILLFIPRLAILALLGIALGGVWGIYALIAEFFCNCHSIKFGWKIAVTDSKRWLFGNGSLFEDKHYIGAR